MIKSEKKAGTAPLSSAVHQLILQRRSIFSFSAREVDDDMLRLLLDAARWAPSSFNEQPWMFLLARRGQEERTREQMLTCLSPHNRRWAHSAPVLLLAIARCHFASSGQYNRHAAYDLGLAMGNLEVQASALGLSIHQMGGFDVELARNLFVLGEGQEPLTISAIGFELEPAQAARRHRKPLGEIVVHDFPPKAES